VSDYLGPFWCKTNINNRRTQDEYAKFWDVNEGRKRVLEKLGTRKNNEIHLFGIHRARKIRRDDRGRAAQSDKYSKMAPVDEYLMERNAEILLARSAAPDSISSAATLGLS
jgi:hypothetical protein